MTVTYQSTSSGGGGGSRNNSYAVSTPKADNGSVTVNNGTTAKKGDTVEFPVALVVDGDKVTVNAKDLANISVKAEVVNDEAKGPKISIMKYKNKTGVARRKGHRQQLTAVKITAIA